jgi:uncharacterized protein (TIGR00251 family)
LTTPGLRRSGDELLLDVLVVPRASRDELKGWDADGRLRVRLRAPPVDGRANRALVAFLAGELSLPSGKLRVSRGMSSRRKTVAIRGIEPADVERVLGRPGE